MDFAELKRRADAAREFDVAVGGMQFTLRLPTSHEFQVAAMRVRGNAKDDQAAGLLLARLLVEQSVVRWNGVTCEDLAPKCGPEPAELVPGAAGLLLDARDDIASALMTAFLERRAARDKRTEDAAKN